MNRRFFAAFACAACFAAGAAEFKVSDADGFVRVRDEIRAARKSGKIADGEKVEVLVAPGEYLLRVTVALDARDSNVAWRAAGAVRLFGGVKIPRSAFAPVADAATLARLDPAVRGKALVCDAAPFVVKPIPAWPAKINGILPGPWLYRNGAPLALARWPNADAPDGGWFGYTNVVAAGSQTEPGAFEFPGDRAARWNVAKGVWLSGYWKYDWHSEYLQLGAYDAATHEARMKSGSSWGIGKGGWPFYRRRFYALNLLEELDAPGEWYLDREAKLLYWLPSADSRADDELVLAQDLAPFFKLEKTSGVTLAGMSFEYSHGAVAVAMNGCSECRVEDCVFANHSGGAVVISGKRNRVTRSKMRNLGGTAVTIHGGGAKSLLPADNLLDHCEIENYAMFQRTMASGIVMYGCGNAVRDNLVKNAPYIALSYSGNEHLIADNEFDHVVQEAGDSGCIYSGHNASWLGTVIFGNYIHDLAKTPQESDARNGVYFDDCDWGDDVIGNTFVHSGRAIFFGGGKLHGAYNNLVKECGVGVHCDSRGNHWRARGNGSFYWNPEGVPFCRYRHAEAGVDPDVAPWCVAYPRLRRAMDERPEYPGMNVVTGNVFCACKKVYGYDGGAQKVMGKSSPGNVVITNLADAPLAPPQPIRLKDAKENTFASADGSTVARVELDESAHLFWTLDVDGKRVLDRSPLSVVVDDFDFGHRVVPCAAEPLAGIAAAVFTNSTVLVPIRGGIGFKNVSTNGVAAAAELRAFRVPIKNLVTGEVAAHLETCVWSGGAAFRWQVPGAGTHRVAGENSAFARAVPREAVPIREWGRDNDFENGYPESAHYHRGDAVGVCFPEFEHGWTHVGPVVTPWRGIIVR